MPCLTMQVHVHRVLSQSDDDDCHDRHEDDDEDDDDDDKEDDSLSRNTSSDENSTQDTMTQFTNVPIVMMKATMRMIMIVPSTHCLAGPVVKASASRAEDPGFESRLRRDFSGVESYQWLQNWHSSGYPARRLVL